MLLLPWAKIIPVPALRYPMCGTPPPDQLQLLAIPSITFHSLLEPEVEPLPR